MNIEELAIEHQKTADRSLRNEGRIKKLEEESGVLHSLATSVAVMTEQMKNMNASMTKLTTEVEEIKDKPAQRWDSLVEKVLWAVVAAFVGFALAQIGL